MDSAHQTRFIDGVYNFCDRWCERCRFQTRCRVFRDIRRYDDAIARGLPPDEIQDDPDDPPPRPMTASEQLDWETFLAEVNRPPTAEEQAAFERREQRIDALLKRDPLVIASRECNDLARGLLEPLTAAISARDDPTLAVALETISRFTYMLPVKTRRAVHGWLEAKEDDELDDDYLCDVHGTAKLVRLIVCESCAAWMMLQQAGLANGAPAVMIDRLCRLDAALAERFPRAMDFVRPGWDEEMSDG